MKRFLSLLLILTLLFSGSGCWGKAEIEKLSFIMGIGIHLAEDGDYLVTFQLALPGKAGGEGTKSTKFASLTFKVQSIREATSQLYKTIDKMPFTGQTRLVIFSEDVARKGLSPWLDYLSRYYRLRRNVNMIVVKGKNGMSDLCKTTPSGNEIQALNITARIDEVNKNGVTEKITVGNFLSKLATGKQDPVIPGLRVIPPNDSDIRFPPKQEELAVEDLALFKADRLVGWFNGKESRGYMYTTDKAYDHHLTLPYQDKGHFVLQLVNPKISKKIEVVDGSPVIKLKVTGKADLMEVTAPIESSNEAWMKFKPWVDNKASEVIKDEINSAVNKAQELKVDVFGFGQLIYRDKPELWRQIQSEWADMYPDVKVEVEAEINSRRTGQTTFPPYKPKEERNLPQVE